VALPLGIIPVFVFVVSLCSFKMMIKMFFIMSWSISSWRIS
jgi:hypothetical protein